MQRIKGDMLTIFRHSACVVCVCVCVRVRVCMRVRPRAHHKQCSLHLLYCTDKFTVIRPSNTSEHMLPLQFDERL